MSEKDWELRRRKLRVSLGAAGERASKCVRKWGRIGATDAQGTRTTVFAMGKWKTGNT